MFGQLQHPMTLWKQALALGLFVLLFAALTGPAATVAETKEYTSAGTAFGFKLLHQLSKQEPGKNIMFSPYSAYTLLEMVCCGSAGKTAEEMKRVLGLEDVSIDSVGPRNRLLSNENKRNGKGVDLSIANSLWYRKGITLKPEFLRASTDFFQATVEALDFNDTSAAGIINSWSSRSTHGRIGQVVVGPFSSMTGMYLANAVYFKGTWARKFDEQLTHDGIFHLRDGKQKQVRMMAFGYKAPLSYQKGAGFQAVRLPYGSEDVAMTIFLPGQSSTVEELLSWLGSGGSQDATFDSYSHQIEI